METELHNSTNNHSGNFTSPNAKTVLPAVRVQWRVSANIECPHCENVNDFMTVDEWWVFTQIAENNEEFYCPVEFTCEQCKQDFTVNGSDY